MFSQSHSSVSSGPVNFFANATYTDAASMVVQDADPLSVSFDTTGTIMSVYGGTNSYLCKHRLSTPWDVTTASYSVSSMIIPSTLDADPQSLVYSTDGTKVYIFGNTNKRVYQYNLSTAWDISTAVYYNFLSVSGRDTTPKSISFSPDGTSMYLVGAGGYGIYQYTLSTAWDVTTAVYDDPSKAVSTSPYGTRFSSDGSKMYVYSVTNSGLYQYNLTTPWVISTLGIGVKFATPAVIGQPYGIAFNASGTKMYICESTQKIHQYTLSTAWDVTTAVYGSALTITSDTIPRGFVLDPTGTKMYLIGDTNNNVYQYNLTTPDNITFAVLSKSFSVATQTTSPRDIMFDSTGTKMYIVAANATYQYTLSTAWDVATAVYSTSKITSAQDSSAYSVSFNQDGTKMYMTGLLNNKVYQYRLATAWDVSTASYDVTFISTLLQDNTPMHISFDLSGTKMYVTGGLTKKVLQYSLATAWKVGTATYYNSISISSQDATPKYTSLDSTGMIMYVFGSATQKTYQYTLSTAWDVTTAVYISPYVSVSTAGSFLEGLTFSPDGTKMYVVGNGNRSLYQFNLSSAFNLSTAVYTAVFAVPSAHDTSPMNISFDPTGTKMYIVGNTNAWVIQYTLSTAWSVATAVVFGSFSLLSKDSNIISATFNSTGTKMYVLGFTNKTVYQYNLSTAWNATTAVYNSEFSVNAQDSAPQRITFSTDGTKMYMIGNINKKVYQYNLSTAFAVSTAVYANSFLISARDTTPKGIAFDSTGTKMYFLGDTNKSVYQYNLSVAWDVTTAVYMQEPSSNMLPITGFNINSTGTITMSMTDSSSRISTIYRDFRGQNLIVAYKVPTAGSIIGINSPFFTESIVFNAALSQKSVIVNSAGTKMYLVDQTNKKILEYNLTTAWDLTTAVYYNPFLVSGQDTAPVSVTFSPDGSKMYVVGATNKTIYHYNLSTPWSTLSAVFATSKLVLAQDATPLGVSFDSTGTTMLVVGGTNKKVFQYTLSTAWSVSSAVYANSFDVTSQDTQPNGIALSNDNKNMYITGTLNDKVYQYTLS